MNFAILPLRYHLRLAFHSLLLNAINSYAFRSLPLLSDHYEEFTGANKIQNQKNQDKTIYQVK